jgi:hypothetical protein
VLDGEVQHFANHRQHAIRHNRRAAVGDLHERADVPSGECRHGPIAPEGEDIRVQDAGIFRLCPFVCRVVF